METKQLKKLKRSELLGMLLQRSKELEKVQAELEAERAAHIETKETLDSTRIAIEESGSIAEATVRISGIMEEAQAAADQYLQRVREQAEEENAGLIDAQKALDDRRELLDAQQKKLNEETLRLNQEKKDLETGRKLLEQERKALEENRQVLEQEREELKTSRQSLEQEWKELNSGLQALEQEWKELNASRQVQEQEMKAQDAGPQTGK